MDEIETIISKYDEDHIRNLLTSPTHVNKYYFAFYKDVAEIFDAVTRIKNVERNPTGFSLQDAPILGLLVRIWKLLKLTIRFYEEGNAEFIAVIERPIIEASIVAQYLLKNDDAVVEDYRLCSYKDRLRILRNCEEGSAFYQTKAGQRLMASVREKLELEGLDEESFSAQKKNTWRLQGKTFYDIFVEIVGEELYASSYGMMSESIHGSWNESVDWCLVRNEDGTFSTYSFFHEPDVRSVSPIVLFAAPPYRSWLSRIDAESEYLFGVLDRIERLNKILFHRFDELYD